MAEYKKSLKGFFEKCLFFEARMQHPETAWKIP